MERRPNFQPFSNNQEFSDSDEIDDTFLTTFGGLNLSDNFPSSYARISPSFGPFTGQANGNINATSFGAFTGPANGSINAASFGAFTGQANGNINAASFGFSHGTNPHSYDYSPQSYDYSNYFNDKFDNYPVNRNPSGSYYDFNPVYDPYWHNSGMRYNRGGVVVEDFNVPRIPQIVQQHGSFNPNRNRARSVAGFNASGSNFRYGAETSNGFINQFNFSRQLANFSSLDDLRGSIFWVAKDQIGCRFLQRKIEEGKPEDVLMIYLELKDHVCELMVHQFANYLIKKIFEICSEQQITQLILLVTGNHRNLMDICFDEHGTRSVQKLIEHITTPEQSSILVSVLCRITFGLAKDINGHHVIEHCCKYLPVEDNKHILNVIAENCLDIAIDRNGCCVLQQCVGNAEGEPLHRLVAEISANALFLSEHPYGNFVVQYVLGLDIPRAKIEIVARLTGNFVFLSLNKYGSNVVEKCLRECKGPLIPKIINEIMCSCNFLMILQDPYGNYVVQSALSESTGAVHHKLVSLIQGHYDYLHSHPYGKRILARAKGNKSYPYRI